MQKKRKNIPREAIDNEIDNTESSSINFYFFYDKPKKIKDSKQIHILQNKKLSELFHFGQVLITSSRSASIIIQ